MCLGATVLLLLSLVTSPAKSKISATKYSMTAAMATAAPLPTLSVYYPLLSLLPHLPTGKVNPALSD